MAVSKNETVKLEIGDEYYAVGERIDIIRPPFMFEVLFHPYGKKRTSIPNDDFLASISKEIHLFKTTKDAEAYAEYYQGYSIQQTLVAKKSAVFCVKVIENTSVEFLTQALKKSDHQLFSMLDDINITSAKVSSANLSFISATLLSYPKVDLQSNNPCLVM